MGLSGPSVERKQKGSFVKGWFWRMYLRAGFWYQEASECTFVPVFGTGEHPNVPWYRFLVPGNIRQNHPLETTLLRTSDSALAQSLGVPPYGAL